MTSQTSSDPNIVGFCQNCGKSLNQKERRQVGGAVFCEPCLVERLAAASTTGASNNPLGTTTARNTGPNPGLAALLGFIPGVGAMYNGQYAKGIVHLVVFAILVSLSDQHGIFGILVAGWVLYQVIEAHQTAQARRNGTPLPNPFGLNDLGERLGFGRAWPSPSNPSHMPTSTAPPPGAGPASASSRSPYDWEAYAWRQANASRAQQAPPQSTSDPYAGPYAAQPPYTAVPTPGSYPPAPPANRFPTGALWLIGLGTLFLIGNSGIVHGFRIATIIPFALIGLGIWLFVHRMSNSGLGGPTDADSPEYRRRLLNALRGSVWVVLVGILFLLDNLRVLSWSHSWPLFIIVAGLMTLLQRTVVPPPQPIPGPYPYPPPPSTSPASPEQAAVTDIIVAPHDGEGTQL